MLKKEDKNYDLSISIYANRSHNNVQLTYRLDMPVKHVKTLRQSLQGLKPRWTNYYNDGRCNTNDFFYPAPADCKGKERPTQLVFEIDAKEDRLNGKIVKLSKRDDILKKPSLPIAIRSYVYNYRLKTDKEKRSEKWEDTKEAAKDGVKRYANDYYRTNMAACYLLWFQKQNWLIQRTLLSIAPPQVLVLFFLSSHTFSTFSNSYKNK